MTADLVRREKERKESLCTEKLRGHSKTEVAGQQLKDSEGPQEKPS